MRTSRLSLPIAAALVALVGIISPAFAGDEDAVVVADADGDDPVKVVVEKEDGETKTITVDDDGDEPVVTVVETDEDGDTTKITEISDGEKTVTIVTDDDDDDDDDEVIEEIVEEHHHHKKIKWLGLQASAIFSPTGATGLSSSSDGRLRSNQFKACARGADDKLCGYIKGLDLKVQMFQTRGTWTYPRFVGYFRTGFAQGRTTFESGDDSFAVGQARQLDYTAVPLFLGGNLYLFDEFPVRPYGGMGFGFDILRLEYQREESSQVVDASARIGFELHAGLEVRISNYISLNAEIMQLWSARRKMKNLPDYSNTGLSVLAGVTVGIPVRLDRRNQDHHTTVRKVRRVHHH